MGPVVRMAFANAQRSWEEEEHLVGLLASVLTNSGHASRSREEWIELGDGFTLRPQVVTVQPVEPNGVQTVTTVEVAHPRLIPQGVFEFQHSGGDNIREAFIKGFQGWAQVDLPVFLDADLEKPKNSLLMDFEIGRAKVELACNRRVILGPTQHLARQPLATDGKDEHPFCPCCLFTSGVDAFRELIARDTFYGIRLFAMRNADGSVQADCRVNGVDWPAGVAALVKYAQSWPDRGFEFRKQYAVIRSRP